jgi:hypothetical protein
MTPATFFLDKIMLWSFSNALKLFAVLFFEKTKVEVRLGDRKLF